MVPEFQYQMYYADLDHNELPADKAAEAGLIQGGKLPRGRLLWAPDRSFYICYRGGSREYMDEHGCVRVDINRFSIRDRADLTVEKPQGRKRILCLGDSFTFGWGVSVDRIWPRLIEPKLASLGDVRTINCGSSGTLFVDEYWWALRDRFGKFDPDVVLVTLCLNDLVAMPDVCALFKPSTVRGCNEHEYLVDFECEDCASILREKYAASSGLLSNSRLWKLLTSGGLGSRFDLDPNVDWGQWLIDLPVDQRSMTHPHVTHYQMQGTPPEATWKRGGPQDSLRSIRDWCQKRDVRLGVVVWPLFQNLGHDDRYPFETLHRVVREFCDAEEIPVLDLLENFRGQDAQALWVDPSDLHGNEIAHDIASDPIADFVQSIWPGD